VFWFIRLFAWLYLFLALPFVKGGVDVLLHVARQLHVAANETVNWRGPVFNSEGLTVVPTKDIAIFEFAYDVKKGVRHFQLLGGP
jgi:hypothetical protein